MRREQSGERGYVAGVASVWEAYAWMDEGVWTNDEGEANVQMMMGMTTGLWAVERDHWR